MTKPALSVIVVGYDMAREIPRTIRSLSLDNQIGLGAADYEVILIDNGSKRPFAADDCRRWIPDIQIVRLPDPTVSPVPAINHGLGLARGDLIGVMIDGARMASPGLLAMALEASRLHANPVIGSLAFHLGPDVQMRSVRQGYCAAVEDSLLAASGWENDGYALFDISVFAGSSSNGWFVLPAETNALFMLREQWRRLGGYDPNFVTPGGGLANLDTWARACSDPAAQVIMLLGEATFHQVHGGVATNSMQTNWQSVFAEEYRRLRGCDFKLPKVQPRFYGSIHRHLLPSLRASVDA